MTADLPPATGTDHQARNVPLDAHLHTDQSPDSSVHIDVYASQAVERGIPEIAITDHVDFDPSAPAYVFTTFEQRERTVRDAAERWGPRGVAIRFGVEVTWDRRCKHGHPSWLVHLGLLSPRRQPPRRHRPR